MKKLKISSIIVMILVLLIPLTIKAEVEEVNEKYNGEYSVKAKRNLPRVNMKNSYKRQRIKRTREFIL